MGNSDVQKNLIFSTLREILQGAKSENPKVLIS